jgi:hypothetical protein
MKSIISSRHGPSHEIGLIDLLMRPFLKLFSGKITGEASDSSEYVASVSAICESLLELDDRTKVIFGSSVQIAPPFSISESILNPNGCKRIALGFPVLGKTGVHGTIQCVAEANQYDQLKVSRLTVQASNRIIQIPVLDHVSTSYCNNNNSPAIDVEFS